MACCGRPANFNNVYEREIRNFRLFKSLKYVCNILELQKIKLRNLVTKLLHTLDLTILERQYHVEYVCASRLTFDKRLILG